MSDQFETRIRSFVVELLDDPPAAPPFPQPGVVVIDGRTRNGSTMTDTKTRPSTTSPAPSRGRGLAVAAAAFAAILVIVVTAVGLTSGDDGVPAADAPVTTEAEPTTTTTTSIVLPAAEALVGVQADVTGPFGSRPDVVHFEADGTYRVVDQFRTTDTGVYSIDGDVISFESDPKDEVQWAYNDASIRVIRDCQGVVGQYTVVFLSPTTFKLEVIGDACPARLSGANGTEFEIVDG